jgi:hypothetical protein
VPSLRCLVELNQELHSTRRASINLYAGAGRRERVDQYPQSCLATYHGNPIRWDWDTVINVAIADAMQPEPENFHYHYPG